MWLQKEEYNEWVIGLHWIYICSKVSGNSRSLQRSQQREFVVRFCSEWTKYALRHCISS
jgi:hypothetical protein